MLRRELQVFSPAIGGEGGILAHGHYGRPLLAFPSQQGNCRQYEDNGMIEALAGPLEAGLVKIYAVDSYDSGSWYRDDLPLEQRARLHALYEDWILNQVAPFIRNDSGGADEIAVTGVSFGAYHAANFALKHAHVFPLALCQSGVYDVSVVGAGERGDAVYFNNPDYVASLGGQHLDWLRGRVNLLLLCGQGAWEDSTGALESTRRFAHLLGEKGIPHELDVWGHDVPHDWPAWRAQIAHHLPRFL
ncbi:MAG: alpha/beta hydrolase-fold protein [Gaiellaceae bacterium]